MLIDLHTHHDPRAYLEALSRLDGLPRAVPEGGYRFEIFDERHVGRPDGARSGRIMDEVDCSRDAELRFMDRFGIELSVVRVGNPWLGPFDREAGMIWPGR